MAVQSSPIKTLIKELAHDAYDARGQYATDKDYMTNLQQQIFKIFVLKTFSNHPDTFGFDKFLIEPRRYGKG